jgi:hypothetical protein
MAKYDVAKLNVAIDQLLAVSQNSRHRFLEASVDRATKSIALGR